MSSSHPIFPQLAPSRARAVFLVAAVFAFFFAAYTLTQSGDIFSTGDTTIRTEIAENILGRWSVDLHGWQLQYPLHLKKEYFDPRVSVGRDGKTYSTYLLGQPLAIMPFDKLGSMLAVHFRWPYGAAVAWFARLVGPLFGALEVTIFFLFAVRLGYGLPRSVALTAIFGFATSVWPDEQSVLEHTEVSFFILLAFYLVYRFREQGRSSLHLLLGGMALGGAVMTRYQDAFLGAVAIALYLILPSARGQSFFQRLRSGIIFALGLAPFVVFDLWYDWIRFGSILATGHHEILFGYPLTLGVPGLLVSPGKGLLWYCPTIFLLVIAGPRFARRFPALGIAFVVLAVTFVLFYANVTFWHGDPAWGPRYIYPTLPYLTLPLGELLRGRMRLAPAIWTLAAVVVLASLTIQFAAVSVNQWRTWYRVISYEENQGHTWQWVASRYRYFWNPHESPLNFQVHGLYQMAYDQIRHSHKYEIVPPDEDPILDALTTDYAVNQWSFWWLANEFDWWMGEREIILLVVALVSVMLACGTYVLAEAAGVFKPAPPVQRRDEPIPEAA